MSFLSSDIFLYDIFLYPGLFALGAIVGSFLNVCIYRLPRGLSIILPSSRCPSCGMPIMPCDNIPVISYIFLRGRCRSCRNRISLRYPLVEALNGILYILVLQRMGIGWHTLIYLVFVSSMVVITFIDLDFQIIPDGITLPGTLVGLVAGSLLLPDPFEPSSGHSLLGWKQSVIGAAAGFGLYYLIAVLSPIIFKKEGMGGGDIKMMSMVGAFTGWKGVLLTTFAGSLFGSIAGIFLMAFKGKDRSARIPFGPFLAAGALLTLFFGHEIWHWYRYGWHR